MKAPRSSRRERREAKAGQAPVAGPPDLVTEVGEAVRRDRQPIAKAIEKLDSLGDEYSDQEWILAFVHRGSKFLRLFESTFGARPGLYPMRRDMLTARLDLRLREDDSLTREERFGLMSLRDTASAPLACGHRSMILLLTLGAQVCCPVCDYDVMTKTEN